MNIERQKQLEEKYRMDEINRQFAEIQQNHPELLIPGDLVFIKVKINGIEMPAMLDTGAQESIIPLKFARQANLEYQIDYRRSVSYQGVGHMNSIGTIYVVPMIIGTQYCLTTLNVFDEKSPLNHLLIGINTIRSLGLSLNFTKNCVEINGEQVPFLTNTDVNYVTRKPYDCPALKTPLKMNRNKILKSRKQPEFAEGIYDRYDEMNIQKLIITGMSREDAMNLLDVAGGKIENAMLKLSRSKTDLFTSYDTF